MLFRVGHVAMTVEDKFDTCFCGAGGIVVKLLVKGFCDLE
jgi:hypothetical protein